MNRQTHKLKIDTEHFADVVAGKKRSEVRYNDRSYKSNDLLILQEFDGDKLTGNEQRVVITHVLKGGQHGIANEYVVLSIREDTEYV
ncbi:RNA-binding protein [Psychromonas sp. MB-3u-54]|uniref:DUF3850 domain-containing protein n=1 Tax=Psychromonas sp. MB-3u-54 TaxID=2058319 RepID=UPI000C33D157|nr:DUF3850 domain-containing protein [Psychromonas sp. MB-3u-54]PKH02887.1 RNA-binding protein [Psychromonas sp. MB-3u-54]